MPVPVAAIHCPACRYTLTGLPAGPCPECGRPFNPLDPHSYLPRSLRFWLPLAAAAPPLWLSWALALLFSALYFLMCSPTGQLSDVWASVEFLLIPLLICPWIGAVLLNATSRLVLFLNSYHQPRWHWRWLAVPAVLLSWVLIQNSGVLWKTRWWLSRDGFAAAVQPGSTAHPARIGAFLINKVERRPDGSTWFFLGFPDWYSQGGAEIIHSPGIWPGGNPVVHDLGNGWWVGINPT